MQDRGILVLLSIVGCAKAVVLVSLIGGRGGALPGSPETLCSGPSPTTLDASSGSTIDFSFLYRIAVSSTR